MLTLSVPLVLFSPGASAAPIIDVDYPGNANAEYPIHIFANVTSDQTISYVKIWYINSTSGNRFDDFFTPPTGNNTNGTWTYTIPPMIYKGTLEFHVSSADNSSSTLEPAPALYINIEGPEPVKPFPWNIVVIVIFLAIVLVVTELIFKPGIYRPTGRQRAKALEEEDRKKELEKEKDE